MSEQIVTPDSAALTVPNKDAKINLLDLNRQQMREFFKNMGEKPFRADQVMTVGFFGISQAGKSYLISALAAGSNGSL